jgi:hypothetical protein
MKSVKSWFLTGGFRHADMVGAFCRAVAFLPDSRSSPRHRRVQEAGLAEAEPTLNDEEL